MYRLLRFEQPFFLLLLLAIPALFLLRRRGVLVPPSLPLTLSDWGDHRGGRFNTAAKRYYRFMLCLSRMLLCAAFAFVVTALAGPVFFRQERVYLSKGTEIIFAIDVSPSMAAEDMSGTRLDAAKQAIRLLSRQGEGMAYGLVALGQEAALIVPPTVDYDSFRNSLDSLMIGSLGDGTALGTGLTVALYHARASSAPQKSIVLLTDGENNAGALHPNTVSRLAAESGVIVYVLGIGTKGSVPLNYRDPVSGAVYRGFLDSRFDEGALRAIAGEGGGAYYGVGNLAELETALANIKGRTTVNTQWRDRRIDEPLYHYFLTAAVSAALLGWFILRVVLRVVL
jgi:Ca-activated chloride channel family protein